MSDIKSCELAFILRKRLLASIHDHYEEALETVDAYSAYEYLKNQDAKFYVDNRRANPVDVFMKAIEAVKTPDTKTASDTKTETKSETKSEIGWTKMNAGWTKNACVVLALHKYLEKIGKPESFRTLFELAALHNGEILGKSRQDVEVEGVYDTQIMLKNMGFVRLPGVEFDKSQEHSLVHTLAHMTYASKGKIWDAWDSRGQTESLFRGQYVCQDYDALEGEINSVKRMKGYADGTKVRVYEGTRNGNMLFGRYVRLKTGHTKRLFTRIRRGIGKVNNHMEFCISEIDFDVLEQMRKDGVIGKYEVINPKEPDWTEKKRGETWEELKSRKGTSMKLSHKVIKATDGKTRETWLSLSPSEHKKFLCLAYLEGYSKDDALIRAMRKAFTDAKENKGGYSRDKGGGGTRKWDNFMIAIPIEEFEKLAWPRGYRKGTEKDRWIKSLKRCEKKHGTLVFSRKHHPFREDAFAKYARNFPDIFRAVQDPNRV